MTANIRFLDSIGEGVEMQDISSGFNYFRNYTEVTTSTLITKTYTTADFNGLGIDTVVQEIRRDADVSVVRFFADGVEVIRATGSRTDVGQWTDYDIESQMDRSIPSSGLRPVIEGTKFGDFLLGEYGSGAVTSGRAGNDTIIGGSGKETLYGGNGSDSLDAAFAEWSSIIDDQDKIYGGNGNDTLIGGEDADILFGGLGRDQLYAGIGNDTVTGGAAADRFFFGAYGGSDIVTDFDVATDSITFFGGVTRSSLKITSVASGVEIKSVYGIKIILEGADLAEVQADANFHFLM